MVLGQYSRAVGVLPSRQAAESALSKLRDSGFSMAQVSVVTKDLDQAEQLESADISDPVADKAKAGATTGAVTGTALGSLGGLLVGLSTLAVSGVGPVIAGGTVGTTLATTLAGSGIGAAAGGIAGGLGGALAGFLGLSEEQASVYGTRLSCGDYVVIVDGTRAEIEQAESNLSHQDIQEWGVYDIRQDLILTKQVRKSEPIMIEVEIDIAGTPPGGRPFEGYRTAKFSSLPRIREYVVLNAIYYEVEKIFYWEGERPPRLILRYAGSIKTES
ncbi:MAG: hypothetical protein JO235_00765 [Chroococcidiopsidaceae cyanobacterium CP_BM_RX_35]|nr:hypothetical protein [Chroococcidiopsidaceae cyanobacterium CP_BM_RX_35]